MAEYESNKHSTDEWYTPPELIKALGETYDLDPCSPRNNTWIPAKTIYTKNYDGLKQEWNGFVFMNPPFGSRNSHIPWLKKFIQHGNGIAIVRAYTSSKWFHDFAIKCDSMLFPKGKTKFIRPDGSIGKSPGHGIVLLAMGERGTLALQNSGLGFFVNNMNNQQFKVVER